MPQEYAAVMSAAITDEKFYENPLKAAEDIYGKLTNSSGINVKGINTDNVRFKTSSPSI